MNVEDVEREVDRIQQIAGDDEAAHSAEDALRRSVLEAIANGASQPKALALAALMTDRIDFARWCA